MAQLPAAETAVAVPAPRQGHRVEGLGDGGTFFANMAPGPTETDDAPYNAEVAGSHEAAQTEREAILVQTIDAARYLMEVHGTETQRDSVTLVREYSWTSSDGLLDYKVQEMGAPANSERGAKWNEPVVLSVSPAGTDGEYLTRVNLTPKQIAVQSRYIGGSDVLGGTSDEILATVNSMLYRRAATGAKLRGYVGRVAAIKATATAESAPEMPRVRMPNDIVRRLRLVSDSRGVQQPSATSHDGPIYEITADLGHTTEVVDNPAAEDNKKVRHLHFSTTYAHTTLSEITLDALPDSILVSVDGTETRYRIWPNGDLSPYVYESDNTGHSLEVMQTRITQLGRHLEHMMEEGQYTAAMRDRVAMFVDRSRAAQGGVAAFVNKIRTLRGSSELPIYSSDGPMRVGEDEVDFSIREQSDYYEVNLGIVSPDGQAPYVRQLIIPKDRRQAPYETSVDGRKYTKIEDLVDAALDRALSPPSAITQAETPREGNEYHQAYLTVDEVMTNAGARVLYGRSEEIGPHISRLQWHTILGPNGERHLIQRFGRLGEHGQIDWLYTRVQQGLYPAYELTRNGFIPTKAYRGGVTPRMTRRQRQIAEAEFEQFAAALEFNARQAR